MLIIYIVNLYRYEQYLIAVLHLYGSICRGRNLKAINIITNPDKIGLTEEFIRASIKYFGENINT